MLRKFNLLFKKDENGKHREWREIEEQKIRDMHAQIKLDMDEIINEFKYIKIPKVGVSEPQLTRGFSSNPTPGGDGAE